MSNHQTSRPFLPHTIRRLSVPILLFWVALAAVTNAAVPQLEDVGKTHNVAMNSPDAPSLQATKRIGQVFREFDSDSSAMVVLEGDQPLGADAHRFYDTMIRKLERDRKHVEHVQDFWGDTLTAAGSQSSDGKAAYVQVFLAGNLGSALANESVGAVRDIVDHTQPPPGVKAYVTGPAPLISDQFDVGSKGTAKVTTITIGVIALMLFFVYRSVLTTLLVLVTVLIEMAAARGSSPFSGTRASSGCRRTRRTCSRCWSSPPGPTMRSSSSAATRRHAARARTEKPPSTPCFAEPPTSSWVRASRLPARCSA